MASVPNSFVFGGLMYDKTSDSKTKILNNFHISKVIDVAECTDLQLVTDFNDDQEDVEEDGDEDNEENVNDPPDYVFFHDVAFKKRYDFDVAFIGDEMRTSAIQPGMVDQFNYPPVPDHGVVLLHPPLPQAGLGHAALFRQQVALYSRIAPGDGPALRSIYPPVPEVTPSPAALHFVPYQPAAPGYGAAPQYSHQQNALTTAQIAAARVNHQQLSASFPTVSQRVMPPRATIVYAGRLPYGFDLPAAQRAMLNPIPPADRIRTDTRRVQTATCQVRTITRRSTWQPAHSQYLDELVWLAALQLNREPTHIEYKAIAEALHRQFQNDPSYQIRSYNALHSKIVKRPGYKQWIAQILSGP